jgi:hypothetical protein
MTIKTISPEQYVIERAIRDKAAAYWQANATFARNGASSMSQELCQHPDYAACDNAMRGRVAQFELLRDMPETIAAYIGKAKGNGMGCDRASGQSYTVTTWTGDLLGYATKGAAWRVNSYIGSHMAMFYARIGGREYVGRGFGEGMSIVLRETAASKRARKAAA